MAKGKIVYQMKNIADDIPLGSVIYTKRPLYKHYGVYIGGGRVVHFAAKKGYETNAKEAFIQETTIENFLKGDELFVEKEICGSFSAAEVVARAKGEVGRQKGEYSLVFNNCEHFAHWSKYGKKKSAQVEVAVAVAIVSTAAIATAVVASGKEKK